MWRELKGKNKANSELKEAVCYLIEKWKKNAQNHQRAQFYRFGKSVLQTSLVSEHLFFVLYLFAAEAGILEKRFRWLFSSPLISFYFVLKSLILQ